MYWICTLHGIVCNLMRIAAGCFLKVPLMGHSPHLTQQCSCWVWCLTTHKQFSRTFLVSTRVCLKGRRACASLLTVQLNAWRLKGSSLPTLGSRGKGPGSPGWTPSLRLIPGQLPCPVESGAFQESSPSVHWLPSHLGHGAFS